MAPTTPVFDLKEHLKRVLAAEGYEVEDLRYLRHDLHGLPDVRGPRFSHAGGAGPGRPRHFCLHDRYGDGHGANKVKGIRAALATNPEESSLTRSTTTPTCWPSVSGNTKPEEATRWRAFSLNTGFESGGRHERRVDKMMALEREDDAGTQAGAGPPDAARKGEQG